MKLLFKMCLFLTFTSVFSQKYTEQPEAFQNELRAFAEKIKSDDWLQQVELLSTNMNEGCLSSLQTKSVMNFYNRMDALGMRYNPHLYNFITTINKQCELGNTDLDGWLAVIDLTINRSKRGSYSKVSEFITFSKHFFNTNALVTSKQRDWVFNASKYKFKIKDKEPYLSFENGTLKAISKKDSLIIQNTSGNFYPFTNEWQGNQGRTDWKRAEWEENSIAKSAYVELSNYRINMNRSEYRADSVTLNFDYMLYKPLKGSFYDKLSIPIDGMVDFPQFDSYDKNIQVDNVDPNLRFNGGFGLYGRKMQVKGDTLIRANLKIYDEAGNLKANANSRFFGLKDRKTVYSDATEVSVYMKQDSIYHPNLALSYFIQDKQIRLVRGDDASSKIAFMDGYHQMELNTDALEWNLNDTLIVFRKSTQIEDTEVKASSFNFYDRKILSNYKIGLTKDPIILLSNWSESLMTNKISAASFAAQIKPHFKVENVIGVIFDLVRDGFIYYDPLTQEMTIRNKARFYAQCAKDASDYDILEITSSTNKTNFQIDLNTNELWIKGVRQVELSDTQKVAIFPLNNTIQMYKNRDFYAFGDASAAAVDLIKGEYTFKYADFNLNIDTLNQLLFYVPSLRLLENGEPEEYFPINTYINNLSGNIQIDASGNKSSRIKTTEYPILSVTSPSYIYYDNSNMFDGAYKRESFYFELDPFTLEHLDSLQRDQLVFEGEMNYGNIFPDIRQTVTLQEDLTLGFNDYEAQLNTPVYGGVGTFNGKINLSNKGLLGNGEVDFLSATIWCNEFAFLPDLMLAKADTLVIEKETLSGIEFPRVDNKEVTVKWQPYADSMSLKAKTPFDLFEAKMRLAQGNMMLTSKGLTSNGKVTIEDANFTADVFKYTSEVLSADSASMQIRLPETDYDIINAKETAFTYNPYTNKGTINPNKRYIPTKLEDIKFYATSDSYDWNRTDSTLTLTDKAGFITSYNEYEDSLVLPFTKAVYNYGSNTIDFEGAKQITVADAYILPENQKIRFTKAGRVDSLFNAVIMADTALQYHKISNANLKIKSGYEFEGEGDYVYRSDFLDDQIMHLDNIKTKRLRKEDGKIDYKNNAWHTISSTEIKPEKNFLLDPHMNFKGAVFLDSKDPFLTFDGYGKIIMKSDLNTQWFQFKNLIDPNNLTIDLSKPFSEDKDSLYVGILVDYNDYKLTSAFLSPKATSKDLLVFDGRGAFNYSTDKKLYQVGDSLRMNGQKRTGNILYLDDENNTIIANGKFKMFDDFGMLDAKMAGIYEHNLSENEYTFNDLILTLDFEFDKKLFELFTKHVKNWSQDADEIEYLKSDFKEAIPHFFDEDKVGTVLTDLETKEYFDRPDKFLNKMMFSNLNMVWDEQNSSFLSIGQFGLSYLGETYVNRMVDGFIEFVPRPNGDQLNIYLEFTEPEMNNRVWYYFTYKKGVLEANSFNPEFNEGMNGLNPKKSVIADKNTGEIYQYVLGSPNKKNNFVIRMMEAKQFYENKANNDK